VGDGGYDRHPRRCVLEHAGDTGTWHGEAACLNRGRVTACCIAAGRVTACGITACGVTACGI
jgi:hypothetical protein